MKYTLALLCYLLSVLPVNARKQNNSEREKYTRSNNDSIQVVVPAMKQITDIEFHSQIPTEVSSVQKDTVKNPSVGNHR